MYGDSLVDLKEKLTEFHDKYGNDIADILNKHKALQDKNDNLRIDMLDFSTRVECTERNMNIQELRIDQVKDQTLSHEIRIEKNESMVYHFNDKLGEQTSAINILNDKTDNQETRITKLKDENENSRIQMDKLGNQVENQECQIDHLQVVTGHHQSQMDLLTAQSITQEAITDQMQSTIGNHTLEIQDLVHKTSDQETREIEVRDQLKKEDMHVKELTSKVESHECRIDQLEQEIRPIEGSDVADSVLASLPRVLNRHEQWKNDIQKYLIAKYQEDLSTIPVSPILQRVKTTIKHVYTKLLIRDDLVHKEKIPKPASNRDIVESYQAVFNDDNKPCRKIYIVGDAGIGKTTWSRKLVGTWTDAIRQISNNDRSGSDEIELQKFDLVFFIELRHAKIDSHISEMLEHQLFRNEPELMTKVKTLMQSTKDSSKCLIVLDGLDEWVSRNQSPTRDGLPGRDPRWKSTVITTTRSWKLEELQLEPQKIDRAVEIRGLQEADTTRLVDEVVSALNTSTGNDKVPKDFKTQCHASMRNCLQIPLMLTFFVCLWYEEGQIDELLAGTFCGLVELLIKYAEGDARKGLYQKLSPEMLEELKEKWKKENCWTPNCFANTKLCELYSPFLMRLGKMAFDHLFACNKESTLVFDYQSIRKLLSEEEMEVALNSGILSQRMHRESVLEQEFCLSFLHKTVQEFLAALYMASGRSKQCLKVYTEYCTDVYKVLEMENVLMFVSGLRPEFAGEMSHHIASMERNKSVHQLLLRCMRQEYAVTNTVRHIYIKHIFLYGMESDDEKDYNNATVLYLKMAKDIETTLCVDFLFNAEVLTTCLADIGNVRLVDVKLGGTMLGLYLGELDIMLQFSDSSDTASNCEIASSKVQWYLPSEHLIKLHVAGYRPFHNSVLDLSGCRKLRTLHYIDSTAPLRIPSEPLEEINIREFSARDTLTEEELSEHQNSEDSILDMSRCKSLKALRYESSKVPIRLPLEYMEHLEKVEIVDYQPYEVLELDLLACRSLKTLRCMDSIAPVKLPLERQENLEKLEMTDYTSDDDSTLDMSGYKYLRTLSYKWSSVPIKLSNDRLEHMDIRSYTPKDGSDLDMSTCISLKTVFYAQSTAQIRFSSEKITDIVIIDYKPSNESALLDLTESKMLRSLRYGQSRVPIRLDSEHLQKVDIREYKPNDESDMDLSECKYLRTLCCKQTTARIVLPSEQLEKVDIIEYTPRKVAVLDMSRCKSLRTVAYQLSTVPILLPSENLEEVKIVDYTSGNQCLMDTLPDVSVLDLSGCKKLKTLAYINSSVPIRVPPERLEKVDIKDYTPDIEPVLDMSGCSSLKTVSYLQSTASLRLPSEQLQKLEIAGYRPRKVTVLDLSECEALTSLDYKMSVVPIKLPKQDIYKQTDASTVRLMLDRT